MNGANTQQRSLALSPKQMAISIAAGLLPFLIATYARMVLGLPRLYMSAVMAMVLVPILVVMPSKFSGPRNGAWLLRFGVLVLAQLVGHISIWLFGYLFNDQNTYVAKLILGWAGLIPAMLIPIFTTESPLRANPALTRKQVRSRQLLLLALGMVIGAIYPGLDDIIPYSK